MSRVNEGGKMLQKNMQNHNFSTNIVLQPKNLKLGNKHMLSNYSCKISTEKMDHCIQEKPKFKILMGDTQWVLPMTVLKIRY